MIKGFKFTGSAGSLIYDTNIDNIYVDYISGVNLVAPSDYATVIATIQSAEVGEAGLKVTLDKTLSSDSDLNEIAFGAIECIASGASSVALGQALLASGESAQAEGNGTVAAGTSSHAEGQCSIASGTVSHAEGLYTTASSDNSHAEGGYTVASNYEAHAEGWHTVASGEDSHVEGIKSIASGKGSHAEGGYNDASGTYSHAEGNGVSAKGSCSHAEGGGLGTIHLTGNNGVYTITGGYNFQNTFDLNDLVGAYIYKNLTNLYENCAKISKIELENEYTLKVTLDTDLGELNK
jgi:hypothetical protein